MSLFTRALRRIGRWAEPLFDPDAVARRGREERLLSLVREQNAALQEIAAQTKTQVRRVFDTRAADRAEMLERIAELRGGVRRQSAALGRLVRRAGINAELDWTEQRVIDRLERITTSGAPIIIGPWTGEVGFELLYWLPFVRWVIEKYRLEPERLVVVSRGGVAPWYGDVAERYRDVFSLVRPEQFRTATEAVKKQRTLRLFDRRLLRSVQSELGGEAAFLHPALMYALFMPYWKRQASIERVMAHTTHRRIDAPFTVPAALPKDYVAVRFYFSACFPDTPANRTFIARSVAALAADIDVVMLNPGISVDDHVDAAPMALARIHTVDPLPSPENNLAVQTAIIARARAFVGTYGGFSYLAPLCGVDAISFYSDRNYFRHHLEMGQRVFEAVGGGRFHAIDTGQSRWLRLVLGAGTGAGA